MGLEPEIVMYDWHNGWGAGDWVWMGFMMLVFWGAVVALVVYLVRATSHPASPGPAPSAPSGDTALRVLDERFARGEIDAEDYKARRDLLRGR